MVIALLTDFGTRDHYVAAMKGVVLTIAPNASIVDISHEIPPHDIRKASFVLRSCYRDFPAETIFVAVVDPGVGSDRRAIAVRSEDRVFIAPDNGLLSFLFSVGISPECYQIADRDLMAGRVSNTFHGRDIFAPVAAHLSSGVAIGNVGPTISDPHIADWGRPYSAEAANAVIADIDRFGNIVTNLSPEDLEAGSGITLNGRTITARRTDYQAESQAPFIIEGSSGLLEISVNSGSAADLFGAKSGDPLEIAVRK
jgi:S-adenosylmethionine hydrolase